MECTNMLLLNSVLKISQLADEISGEIQAAASNDSLPAVAIDTDKDCG